MEKRWCSACGEMFEPRPQSPRQAYCKSEECQRARKRLWQRAKRRTDDDDYHQNQLAAQKAWRKKHPDYWRNYRQTHPEYTAENRSRQYSRNEQRSGASQLIAKSDASSFWPPPSGLFELVEIGRGQTTTGRSWTVHLTLVTSGT